MYVDIVCPHGYLRGVVQPYIQGARSSPYINRVSNAHSACNGCCIARFSPFAVIGAYSSSVHIRTWKGWCFARNNFNLFTIFKRTLLYGYMHNVVIHRANSPYYAHYPLIRLLCPHRPNRIEALMPVQTNIKAFEYDYMVFRFHSLIR